MWPTHSADWLSPTNQVFVHMAYYACVKWWLEDNARCKWWDVWTLIVGFLMVFNVFPYSDYPFIKWCEINIIIIIFAFFWHFSQIWNSTKKSEMAQNICLFWNQRIFHSFFRFQDIENNLLKIHVFACFSDMFSQIWNATENPVVLTAADPW